MMGFELMTSSLPRMRSTPELHRLNGAEDEVRTRDPQLGRLMLYQLSYFRGCCGRRWTRTTEPEGADLQSAAIAAMRSSRYSFDTALGRLEPIEGFEPTTPRLQITCSGQLSYIGVISMMLPFHKGIAKIDIISYSPKLFQLFLISETMFE